MSAIKEYALSVERAHELADGEVYCAVTAMQDLADKAWIGDHAAWAPDAEWLAATRHQLELLQQALTELETARDCIDLR